MIFLDDLLAGTVRSGTGCGKYPLNITLSIFADHLEILAGIRNSALGRQNNFAWPVYPFCCYNYLENVSPYRDRVWDLLA